MEPTDLLCGLVLVGTGLMESCCTVCGSKTKGRKTHMYCMLNVPVVCNSWMADEVPTDTSANQKHQL